MLQLNDFVGTVEPHLHMSITNYQKSEESLSFVAFSAIFKNCCLIYIMVMLMPETRPDVTTNHFLYGLYEFLMPIFVCLIICIPTTLAMKHEERYQRLAQ